MIMHSEKADQLSNTFQIRFRSEGDPCWEMERCQKADLVPISCDGVLDAPAACCVVAPPQFLILVFSTAKNNPHNRQRISEKICPPLSFASPPSIS
jgi:hypothetical protein